MGTKIINVIKKIEEGILFLFLAIILICCICQVIGRHTDIPFSAAFEEIAVNMFIWMTMLGAGVAVRTHSHMRMDILDSLIPKAALPYLDILRDAIVAVIFGAVAYITLDYIPIVKRTAMTTSALDIPQYILYYAMPIGFGLMVFWSIINIIETCKRLRKGAGKTAASDTEAIQTE